jgi:hypothetical protein
VTEYLCLTILGDPDEPDANLKARLTAFWTHMIRNRPDDYERVYAEATRFGRTDGRPSRQYMVEAGAVHAVTAELTAAGLAFAPPDHDDTYSKYEASSPDWFQIEH